MATDSIAHQDWLDRIDHRRSGTQAAGTLSAPTGVRAVAGRGQVTIDWDDVPGAAGYLVQRGACPDGPFSVIDHEGEDVAAIPHGPYTDTTDGAGSQVWYAVAAVLDVDTAGPPSRGVQAEQVESNGTVTVRVAGVGRQSLRRPWRPMIGSEHLSHLLSTDCSGGRVIGAELGEALAIAHRELGVTHVRAHAILGDDLGTYREVDGRPIHDFAGIDRVYDLLRSLGLRPVVELGFMPRDLARDPETTVFGYRAIISPPKDWRRWSALIADLTSHLVDRYGLDEVRTWSFEVWNEPNLEVFWGGSQEEYFRLYDETARAVRSVDPQLVVGGPSTAAAAWVDDLLRHVQESGAPLDFVSTHVYGNAPMDFRATLERYGRSDAQICWTEWGPTPTHFKGVGDGVLGAGFLLRGMASAMGRIQALSHWVASDHFEELGRPPALLHGGFGLLSVGNLRKPRFWALRLLEELGDDEHEVSVGGDGAGGMVQALAASTTASRGDAASSARGTLSVLIWNSTLEQRKVDGDPALDRRIELTVDDLPDGPVTLSHRRIDADHTNVLRLWEQMSGGADWPTPQQWDTLHQLDRLEELEPARTVIVQGGRLRLDFDLPMPGVSALTISPSDPA